MTLSLVITTFNRAGPLEELLRSLEAQTDKDFQVVVAIDGSTDDTEDMLARLAPAYDLKWVNTHCSAYGLAVARNHGILAADGRAVVILDDDSFPEPGLVAAHRASVRAGTITGGPRWPSDPAAERMAWKARELLRVPPLTPMTVAELQRDYPNAYLIENNICMLRDDWIGMGLFSERLKLYGYIGQEFFARARHLGLRYQVNPDAGVCHRGELEGDNGIGRSRKTRQTNLSALIRPSLMTPAHYRAQIAWADASSKGLPAPSMPPFALHAALSAPHRLVAMASAPAKRFLKRTVRRVLVRKGAPHGGA